MKQFFLAVIVLTITSVSMQAQVKPKAGATTPKVPTRPANGILKSQNDSFSYALGINIANNLKQQGIDKISNLAMQKGLDDVFNKQPFLLNEQQANLCIQQKIQATMSKKNELVKVKGMAFLAANKKKPGVIVLPDGLQYEVLKKGDSSSAKPGLQDTVVVNYAGTTIDGQKVDNSYDRGEPLTIAVGRVISGWAEILQLMHLGDKWRVFIPSELAYGERGAGANIPGGSTLIFEMELLAINHGTTPETPKQN